MCDFILTVKKSNKVFVILCFNLAIHHIKLNCNNNLANIK